MRLEVNHRGTEDTGTKVAGADGRGRKDKEADGRGRRQAKDVRAPPASCPCFLLLVFPADCSCRLPPLYASVVNAHRARLKTDRRCDAARHGLSA
jgi:hypothetical protein